MSETERPTDSDSEADDLLEGARALEAEEQALERETKELERLEEGPREWLNEQSRFHWPVEDEPEPEGDEGSDAAET